MPSVLKVNEIQNTQNLTAMEIDSSGVVTQPTKPMFDVRGLAGQSLSSAAFIKVQFNNEQFDIGGYYDPTTNYRYTPLVASMRASHATLYLTGVQQITKRTSMLKGWMISL